MSANTRRGDVDAILKTVTALNAEWKAFYAALAVWTMITLIVRPSLFATQLVNGLMFGIILVLISLGLALILGLMGVINFAHGWLFMLGGYIAYAVVTQVGLPFWAALIVAPIAVGLFGALMERFLLRRLYGTDPINGLLLTFGIALMMEEGMRYMWGSTPLAYSSLGLSALSIGPITVGATTLFTVVIGSLTIAAVYLLIVRTDFGLDIRAGVQDPEMTKLVGVNLPLKFTILFFIGSAIAGLAGVLRGAETGIDPGMGALFIILAFVIIVVGGMGSFFGSIVGGLLIGLAMFLIPVMLNAASIVTGLPLEPPAVERVIPYLVMIVVLLARPRGLLGEEGFLE